MAKSAGWPAGGLSLPRPAAVRNGERRLEPSVEFVLVGDDVGFRSAGPGPVDGHAELLLPPEAGPLVIAQISGDLLPGTEDVIFGGIFHRRAL